MLKRVKSFIHQEKLFDPGDTVVVAVSGGADSVALLHFLANAGLNLRLVVAHLNHGLRGEESDLDASFVEQYAFQLGLPYEMLFKDVSVLAQTLKTSLEEAGREARYTFLSEVAQRYGAQRVALAHHADDQAETVLLMLIRGAGTAGLGGMLPKDRDGRIVRPFLGVTRYDIEQYLNSHHLTFRIDSTNTDTRYLRNRIRLELLPLLKEYNPQITERLLITSRLLVADEALLSDQINSVVQNNVTFQNGTATIDVEQLRQQLPAFRYRVYRSLIQRIKGDLRRIDYGHACAIDGIALGTSSRSKITLPGNIMASKSYNYLTIRAGEKACIPYEFVVEGAGTYPLPCGGELSLQMVAPSSDLHCSRDIAYFDVEKVPFPWVVRTYQHGDYLFPFGMTGRKKLKDLFVDCKMPHELRTKVPVVTSGGKIIWIAGLRAGREGTVDRDSSRVARAILSGFELLN